ncbi:MAG: hypothetical protein P8170_14975 [Gemmatimonadota bacterium]|jgi:hypothetical protein
MMTDETEGTGAAAEAVVMRELEERILSRLSRVEHEARLLRARTRFYGVALTVTMAMLAVVAVYPGLLSTGSAGNEGGVLQVSALELVGEDGQPRGRWAVDEDGSVRLSLLDRQARTRLGLTVLGGGHPGLSLVNSEGKRRAVLGLLQDETTTLVFADRDGIPRAVLGLTQGNAASLVFAGADGVSRMGLGLDGEGNGSVVLPEDAGSE